MELVPILSTIILVGTIATFILAVAAYILYKIRERRGREAGAGVAASYGHPEPHVLVAPQQPMGAIQQSQPAPPMYAQQPQQQPHPQQRMPQQAPQRQAQQAGAPSSLFWEYTDEGFVPVNPQEEARRQQAEAQAAAQAQAQAQAQTEARQQAQQQQAQQDEGYAWL